MKKFLIIDGYNMIIRSKISWTKVPGKNFVVLSFLKNLYNSILYLNPDKVIIALDDYVGNSFRRQINPDYKKYRQRRVDVDPFSEDFKKQKEFIIKIIENILPINVIKYKGYEADDLIAMFCKICSDDIDIVIWSNDYDFVQIQQKFSNVKVFNPHSKEFFDTPSYDLVTYKSLVGDRSDNIKSVRGISHKMAQQAMESYSHFINDIASNPIRYTQYRQNRRIIDLLDNDLPIPKNFYYILNNHVKYNEEQFKSILLDNNFNSIVSKIDSYNCLFNELEQKSKSDNENCFYNKKTIIR